MSPREMSFINMTGNKKKLIGDIFQSFDRHYNTSNYIEPFFGSGGAYCNLPIQFDKYECSDIIPFVIDFLNSKYDFDMLATFFEGVMKRWDIQNCKEDYYSFRDFWNQNKDKSDKLKNIGFILLANACINNMMRFGPQGFNQSYGNRSITKERLCSLYSLVKPNTVFKVKDFREVEYVTDSFVYLDPPYSGTGAMTNMYGFYNWAAQEDKDLLTLIAQKKKDCSFVLSTIDGSILEKYLIRIGFSKYNINGKKYKVTPWAFDAKDYQEVILTNINAI